jgi:lipopolysaccharide transport system permease protein
VIEAAGLRRYVSLVSYMTYADLRAESERTYVGFLWWVLEPVISMFVYYLVFQVIMQRGTPDYVQFLFVGLVPWRWLQTTVVHGANSILRARSLMQQVYLTKLVFPVVSILTDTFKFLLVFLLALIFVWITGFDVGISYLALPLVMLVQLLLIVALTTFFAGVAPLVPDVRIVLDNLVRLWFFLSGIFYDVDRFSEAAQWYLRLNPMTVVIESYREILLEGIWPDLARLAVIGAAASVVTLFAVSLVRRYDYVYPKLRF